MKLADLAEASGVPVATIKFYLREGVLPPGVAHSPRSSDYGPAHLDRLRLIRGMVEVLGAPLEHIRSLTRVLDHPPKSPLAALGSTMAELPSGYPQPRPTDHTTRLAARWLTELGFTHSDPDSPSAQRLGASLALAEALGISLDPTQLHAYATAARTAARADLDRDPWPDTSGTGAAAATFSALGTVLFEPILLSLRRIAQAELAIDSQ